MAACGICFSLLQMSDNKNKTKLGNLARRLLLLSIIITKWPNLSFSLHFRDVVAHLPVEDLDENTGECRGDDDGDGKGKWAPPVRKRVI